MTHAVPHPSGSEMTRPQELKASAYSLAQLAEEVPHEEDTLETESSWVVVGPPKEEGTKTCQPGDVAWACSLMPFANQEDTLIS